MRLRTIKVLLQIYEKVFHPNFDNIYLRFCQEIDSTEFVIFDIGAHKGESIKSFKKLFPNAMIHAFEPDTANFKDLHKKWGNKSKVILNNFAIGDVNTHKEFYTHHLSTTSTFKTFNEDSDVVKLKSKLLNLTPEKMVKNTYAVEIKKLDDYVRNFAIDKIGIMKIDTEGFEYECLQGCDRLLQEKKVDILQIECSDGDNYLQATPFRIMVEFLAEYGYVFYEQKRRILNRHLIDAVFVNRNLT